MGRWGYEPARVLEWSGEMQSAKCRVQSAECSVQLESTEYRAQSTEYRIQSDVSDLSIDGLRPPPTLTDARFRFLPGFVLS